MFFVVFGFILGRRFCGIVCVSSTLNGHYCHAAVLESFVSRSVAGSVCCSFWPSSPATPSHTAVTIVCVIRCGIKSVAQRVFIYVFALAINGWPRKSLAAPLGDTAVSCCCCCRSRTAVRVEAVSVLESRGGGKQNRQAGICLCRCVFRIWIWSAYIRAFDVKAPSATASVSDCICTPSSLSGCFFLCFTFFGYLFFIFAVLLNVHGRELAGSSVAWMMSRLVARWPPPISCEKAP